MSCFERSIPVAAVLGLLVPLCAGCETAPPAGAGTAAPPPAVSAAQPACRDYTIAVTIDGKPENAVGQVCRQPDGSWRVTQKTPGLPDQVYSLPATAYPYPYPYVYSPNAYYVTDGWWFGPPFFVGGAFFVAHRGHGFHHDGDHHHFGHDGMHHGGFSHGGGGFGHH